MKPLFGEGCNKRDDGVDLGDMPIANARYDCNRCAVKADGCVKKVNTLNCLLALKRFNKKQDDIKTKREEEEEGGVDRQMLEAEKTALAQMMKEALAEADEDLEEKEESPTSQSPQPEEDEDEDDD